MNDHVLAYIIENPNNKISFWFDDGEFGVEIENAAGAHLVTATGDSFANAARSALVQVGYLSGDKASS